MVLIGVDPHKSSHTAVAVDERGTVLDTLRVRATQEQQLRRWAEQWPERRWAVEGARDLGRGLTQRLLADGEVVLDVPAVLVARVRQLSGAGRKTDLDDARAVTVAAASQSPRLHAVAPEDKRVTLRLLSERRGQLAEDRTRVVNRLHRLFRDLRPGGAPRELSAQRAAALLRGVQVLTPADAERLVQARELVAEVRVLDRKLTEQGKRMVEAVRASGTGLTAVPGVGAVLAARLIGHAGAVERFPSSAHFASYTGTAPLEASSGEVRRHRLNRRGDRTLNAALHIVAVTQLRHRHTEGYAYYRRKVAEGKSGREALRCLKRRLSDVVYRHLLADARAETAAA